MTFGDKSRFVLYPVDGRQHVRPRTGERLFDECLRNLVAGGGGSVHVWGAFYATGKSELVILDRNMTSAMYWQIPD